VSLVHNDSGSRRRLLIIGLDGVPPELLFDRFLPTMPNVKWLVEHGVRAPLRTSDPPISIPAWPVMFTGVDPGTLGIYGFRHRRPGSYTQMYIPSSHALPVPTLWEILSDRGRRVGVVGMPPGYPPPEVNGVYVSDFLTPPGSTTTTHPPELREEIEQRFGPYVYDVVFRSAERDRLPEDLFRMTERRFQVAESLYAREPWDVFAVHEIGTDRLHHAFWKQFDPSHPSFEPGNPYERIAEEYYTLIDDGIGRLLAHADESTEVLIVSDHGSMAMSGCFCINQWLEEKGYLVLKRPPLGAGTAFEHVEVDWGKTTAWGAGGYYARLFFNLEGREAEGRVPAEAFHELKARLVQDLEQLEGPDGNPLPVRVLDPHEIYAEVRGEAPDLLVYFDELKWRAAGTMGHPTLFLSENDTGPDDAVHSFDGVFLLASASRDRPSVLPRLQIRDVLPTLLDRLGEPIPEHVQGRPIPELVEPRRVPAPLLSA
jgi:predicted AlkP superfamily phosphohydrolase/phosphomutase